MRDVEGKEVDDEGSFGGVGEEAGAQGGESGWEVVDQEDAEGVGSEG